MNHFSMRRLFGLALMGALALRGPVADAALTIQFDYTYDDGGFFSGANVGRRDLLAAAANVFTSRITDSLSAITPDADNTWTPSIFDPRNTSNTLTFSGPAIAADTVLVFVGASNLGASTLGLGGPGGYGASGITQSWFDTLQGRGQAGALLATPTDYGPWGGTLAFNSTSSWYFDPNPATVESFTGLNDFFSVAVHELGHLLGLGTADSWKALEVNPAVSGTSFTGTHSAALQGGNVPLSADNGHWAEGAMSTIAGTLTAQEAAMDPTLTVGTRKYFTDLDYAGLQDVGWQLSAIPEAATLAWAAALGTLGMMLRLRARRH